jgi:hypothetical protein
VCHDATSIRAQAIPVDLARVDGAERLVMHHTHFTKVHFTNWACAWLTGLKLAIEVGFLLTWQPSEATKKRAHLRQRRPPSTNHQERQATPTLFFDAAKFEPSRSRHVGQQWAVRKPECEPIMLQ